MWELGTNLLEKEIKECWKLHFHLYFPDKDPNPWLKDMEYMKFYISVREEYKTADSEHKLYSEIKWTLKNTLFFLPFFLDKTPWEKEEGVYFIVANPEKLKTIRLIKDGFTGMI